VLDQAGQPSGQAFVKAGQGVGGVVFQLANVNPGLDDRAVGPDVGPAEVGHPKNFDIFLGCHWNVGKERSTIVTLYALCISLTDDAETCLITLARSIDGLKLDLPQGMSP